MNMNAHYRKQREWTDRAEGTVLIVTIWVVLVLAGLALVFARSMRVAAIVTANHLASLYAECAAEGGMQYVLAQLLLDEESSTLEGSTPYEAMQVGQGYFWVLRSNLEEDRTLDYGLTDEAGRINLNSASLETLLKLPGMTAELAASIIDWRDEDSELSPGGAESEYYLLLSEPYNCKNSALETVEEVLLIKGASKELLYGEDTNLNGMLDDNENDADSSEPQDNSNGRLEGGFYDYVTVYSVEANVDSSGSERVNINDRGGDELGNLLRQAVSDDRYFDVMDRVRSGRPFANILDFYYKSGLTVEEYAPLVDKLTTSDEEESAGLVNVNTAPKEVLLCLPGLEESDADALIAHRGDAETEDLESIMWVTEVLDEEKAVAVGGYITTRSFQYSADIVAVAANGRAYKRYRAVIDTREDTPRAVYWKSLTDMGWPLQRDIMTSLRAGEASAVLGMK